MYYNMMNPYYYNYIAQRQQNGEGFTNQLPGGNQVPSGGILYVPGMGYMTLLPGTTIFIPGIGYMTFTPTMTANMINQIGAGMPGTNGIGTPGVGTPGVGTPGVGTPGTSPLGGGTGTSPLGTPGVGTPGTSPLGGGMGTSPLGRVPKSRK